MPSTLVSRRGVCICSLTANVPAPATKAQKKSSGDRPDGFRTIMWDSAKKEGLISNSEES